MDSVNHLMITPWAGLLNRWITLSTGEITIQRIAWFALLTPIHWLAIYQVALSGLIVSSSSSWELNAKPVRECILFLTYEL